MVALDETTSAVAQCTITASSQWRALELEFHDRSRAEGRPVGSGTTEACALCPSSFLASSFPRVVGTIDAHVAVKTRPADRTLKAAGWTSTWLLL